MLEAQTMRLCSSLFSTPEKKLFPREKLAHLQVQNCKKREDEKSSAVPTFMKRSRYFSSSSSFSKVFLFFSRKNRRERREREERREQKSVYVVIHLLCLFGSLARSSSHLSASLAGCHRSSQPLLLLLYLFKDELSSHKGLLILKLLIKYNL